MKNHGKYTLAVVKELMKHGRTLRLQSFNNYRKRFNLPAHKSFQELTGQFKSLHLLFLLFVLLNKKILFSIIPNIKVS